MEEAAEKRKKEQRKAKMDLEFRKNKFVREFDLTAQMILAAGSQELGADTKLTYE